MEQAKSVMYFILAGLCEIGGGYLVWLWLREHKSIWYAVLGAFVLVLYGVVPTFQPANFGRVYAAYGGVFIVLSILSPILPAIADDLGQEVTRAGLLITAYMLPIGLFQLVFAESNRVKPPILFQPRLQAF